MRAIPPVGASEAVDLDLGAAFAICNEVLHHNFNREHSNTIDLQRKNLYILLVLSLVHISKMMRSLILLVSAAMAMAASPAFFGRGATPSSIARSSVFGVSRGGGLFGGKNKDE